jgi:hypothetical protein
VADAKQTKAAVHYRAATVPGESCHTCRFRIDHGEAPSTCQKVEGSVRPDDISDLYEAVPPAATLELHTDYFNSVGIEVETVALDVATNEVVRLLGGRELDRHPFTPPSTELAKTRSRRERLLALFR